jgi:hypothetical protein
MYNNDVGKRFIFINLLPTSLLYISILLTVTVTVLAGPAPRAARRGGPPPRRLRLARPREF